MSKDNKLPSNLSQQNRHFTNSASESFVSISVESDPKNSIYTIEFNSAKIGLPSVRFDILCCKFDSHIF